MLLEGCRILPGEEDFACTYLASHSRFEPLWTQIHITAKSCLMNRTDAKFTVHQAECGSDIGLSQTGLGQCNCCIPEPTMHAILCLDRRGKEGDAEKDMHAPEHQ